MKNKKFQVFDKVAQNNFLISNRSNVYVANFKLENNVLVVGGFCDYDIYIPKIDFIPEIVNCVYIDSESLLLHVYPFSLDGVEKNIIIINGDKTSLEYWGEGITDIITIDKEFWIVFDEEGLTHIDADNINNLYSSQILVQITQDKNLKFPFAHNELARNEIFDCTRMIYDEVNKTIWLFYFGEDGRDYCMNIDKLGNTLSNIECGYSARSAAIKDGVIRCVDGSGKLVEHDIHIGKIDYFNIVEETGDPLLIESSYANNGEIYVESKNHYFRMVKG